MCPQYTPTVYRVCICCGCMLWITTYAVEHMLWRTMSMLPTPYAYGVDNTYAVDVVVYTVGTYSVGYMLWKSRTYTVGYICCGYIMWVSRPYAVDNICCGHILWVSRLCCGNIYRGWYVVEITTICCGRHRYMMWVTWLSTVYVHVIHNISPTVYDCIYYNVGITTICCGQHMLWACTVGITTMLWKHMMWVYDVEITTIYCGQHRYMMWVTSGLSTVYVHVIHNISPTVYDCIYF